MSEKGEEVGNGGDNEEGVREKMTEEVEVRRTEGGAKKVGGRRRIQVLSQTARLSSQVFVTISREAKMGYGTQEYR